MSTSRFKNWKQLWNDRSKLIYYTFSCKVNSPSPSKTTANMTTSHVVRSLSARMWRPLCLGLASSLLMTEFSEKKYDASRIWENCFVFLSNWMVTPWWFMTLVTLATRNTVLLSTTGNVDRQPPSAVLDFAYIFSERELTFTLAICYRPSVCLSSVVCNVRAPYTGGSNFRQYPLTSTENFTEIVPGEPLRWGS